MAKRIAHKLDGCIKLLLVIAAFVAVPGASAQTHMAQTANATATPAAYDVVSIKPNKSGSGSLDINANDHTYSATNISLQELIETAYGIRKDLISGLAGPIASARFDVEAKILVSDPNTLKKINDKQRRSMMLQILIERFHLKAHTEIKTLPVFELIVIKHGPKFSHSAGKSQRSGTSIRNRKLIAHEIPMTSFANTLAEQVHRTVIDKTGLSGNYDLTLKWSPEDAPDTQTDSAPPLFTALQEQLGLKLQPAKGPVETLVVDHAEMPSEN